MFGVIVAMPFSDAELFSQLCAVAAATVCSTVILLGITRTSLSDELKVDMNLLKRMHFFTHSWKTPDGVEGTPNEFFDDYVSLKIENGDLKTFAFNKLEAI